MTHETFESVQEAALKRREIIRQWAKDQARAFAQTEDYQPVAEAVEPVESKRVEAEPVIEPEAEEVPATEIVEVEETPEVEAEEAEAPVEQEKKARKPRQTKAEKEAADVD